MNVTNILTVLLVLVGAFMTFLIMLQEGKGGGLTALGGTKAAGIEGVTNPIRRATGYMAGLFFILAIVLAIINRPSKTSDFFAAESATKATEDANPAVPVLGAGPGGQTTPVAPATMTPVTVTPVTKPVETPKAAEPVKIDATKPTEAIKPAETPKADAPKTDATTPATPAAPATPTTPAKTETPAAPATK